MLDRLIHDDQPEGHFLAQRSPGGNAPVEQHETPKTLAKINVNRLSGARDYALLLTALVTGRCAAALAGMRLCHLKRLSDGRLVVHFPRCKEGKQMDELLPVVASTAPLTWLSRLYGDLEGIRTDAPIWVCLSRRDEGKPLTTRSMGQICQRYLGTSKVHVTRHTFARTMEDAGAKVSEISMRLAQDNPAVVGRYLARLRREDNQYADSLVSLYGFKGAGRDES